jgi:hypothetical protein
VSAASTGEQGLEVPEGKPTKDEEARGPVNGTSATTRR